MVLSEDFLDKQFWFFPVAHFRLVTSAGLELFAVGVGGGAPQAGTSGPEKEAAESFPAWRM